ncbi:hypothetical protein L1887_53920 [Cichorium endivia]|nr:hypothetical protein L1887_53920 [Cichorium endivia]
MTTLAMDQQRRGDLRLVEGGLEAEAEAAVAGVAGAEASVVEEKEVSLRESEESSASRAALEIRELLRGVVVAGEGFVGEVPGVEEVGGPGMESANKLSSAWARKGGCNRLIPANEAWWLDALVFFETCEGRGHDHGTPGWSKSGHDLCDSDAGYYQEGEMRLGRRWRHENANRSSWVDGDDDIGGVDGDGDGGELNGAMREIKQWRRGSCGRRGVKELMQGR